MVGVGGWYLAITRKMKKSGLLTTVEAQARTYTNIPSLTVRDKKKFHNENRVLVLGLTVPVFASLL